MSALVVSEVNPEMIDSAEVAETMLAAEQPKKNWKKILSRALLIGLLVGLLMAGISVISSYIAVGSPPNWRSVAASSFSSFMLTAILTFALNYM